MLLPQTIRKLSEYRFMIEYRDLPDTRLIMNFEPCVTAANATDNYCLLHWQAKPRGHRRFGIFNKFAGETNYASTDQPLIAADLNIQAIQVDELSLNTIPTAMLYFPNTRVVFTSQWSIEKLY